MYLCHLLHVLSMIIESGATCSNVYAYICIDGAVAYMCFCILIATACVIDN